jgi:hypothetical protein
MNSNKAFARRPPFPRFAPDVVEPVADVVLLVAFAFLLLLLRLLLLLVVVLPSLDLVVCVVVFVGLEMVGPEERVGVGLATYQYC